MWVRRWGIGAGLGLRFVWFRCESELGRQELQVRALVTVFEPKLGWPAAWKEAPLTP